MHLVRRRLQKLLRFAYGEGPHGRRLVEHGWALGPETALRAGRPLAVSHRGERLDAAAAEMVPVSAYLARRPRIGTACPERAAECEIALLTLAFGEERGRGLRLPPRTTLAGLALRTLGTAGDELVGCARHLWITQLVDG